MHCLPVSALFSAIVKRKKQNRYKLFKNTSIHPLLSRIIIIVRAKIKPVNSQDGVGMKISNFYKFQMHQSYFLDPPHDVYVMEVPKAIPSMRTVSWSRKYGVQPVYKNWVHYLQMILMGRAALLGNNSTSLLNIWTVALSQMVPWT